MGSLFSRSEIARREAARKSAVLRIWKFGNAALDERTLELTVDGKVVPLERKQLELLAFFLQNAGEVIFKDRIAQAVWPGKSVTDSNLTKCIAILRQAIGDHDQVIIKTVHGYGYWLTSTVHVESAAPANLLPDSVTEIAVALR